VGAPRKEPDQMQEPEPEARNGIVIVRITTIQEPQHMLIYEIKPEKPVVLARTAVHREVQKWRVAQCGEHIPWSAHDYDDDEPADEVKPTPGVPGKQLASERHVQESRCRWENDRDQPFQQ